MGATAMASLSPEQSKPLLMDCDSRRQSEESGEHPAFCSIIERRRRVLLKAASLAHPAHLTSLCRRFGYACTPQLLRYYLWDERAPPSKQFSTSYLNALRGITAIKVFTFHYLMAYTDFTFVPWAMDERHNRAILIPVIRYFYSGFTSQVFFGVAGYLTSLRLFQLLDKNDVASQSKVLSNIAGSLFRRGFRLYLPVFLSTFTMMLYIHTGLYEGNRQYISSHELFPGPWNETKPACFDSFSEQFKYWADEMYHLSDVTRPDTFFPDHDQHLWSILSEMRASLHLYACILAIATCKRYVRLLALLVMTYVFYIWNAWETWVYILGAIVAQLDIILAERQENKDALGLVIDDREEYQEKATVMRAARLTMSKISGTGPVLQRLLRTAIRWSGFILAFYLMSFPIAGPDFFAPGYEVMKSYIPHWVYRKDKVYPNLGTGILLFLLARSDPKKSKWRRFLMAPVPQYLGTISFSLYLVHGPLLHMFGYMLPHQIWWLSGFQGNEIGEEPWLAAVLLGWAISLLVSLAVADVWMREVEGRCVRFVKWIESWCFKSKSS